MKPNVKCGICNVRLVWHWYTCLQCPSFTICATCNDLNLSCFSHGNHHPTQNVLTKKGEAMYYENDIDDPYERTFTCPFCYCCKKEYIVTTLLDHLREIHADWEGFVKCPICISRFNPRVLQRNQTSNLINHILYRHTPEPYPESGDDSDSFDTPTISSHKHSKGPSM